MQLVKRWIVIGPRRCSLAGDVALLWPVQGFLVGLVSFLLAHVAYLIALTRRVRFAARPLAFAGWAIVALAVLSGLWHGVPGDLRLPGRRLCLRARRDGGAGFDGLAGVARHGRRGGAGASSRSGERAVRRMSDAILATDKFVGGVVPLPSLFNFVDPIGWHSGRSRARPRAPREGLQNEPRTACRRARTAVPQRGGCQ